MSLWQLKLTNTATLDVHLTLDFDIDDAATPTKMSAGTQNKRGRKPGGTVIMSLSHSASSPAPDIHHQSPAAPSVRWSLPPEQPSRSSTPSGDSLLGNGGIAARSRPTSTVTVPQMSVPSRDHYANITMSSGPSAAVPVLDISGLISLDTPDDSTATTPVMAAAAPLPTATPLPPPTMSTMMSNMAPISSTSTLNFQNTFQRSSMPPPSSIPMRFQATEDDGEGDEDLPAMADDDYSAQQSWNSQSKDNLKWANLYPT